MIPAGENRTPSFEPTILEAATRYWVLVVGMAVLFGLLAALYGITRPVQYGATASLVVEDPAANSLLNTNTAARADRYLLDQMQIMETATVATGALEILSGDEDAGSLTIEDIQANLSVDGTAVSDLVTITYTGETPEQAVKVSDAIARAYQEVVQAEERRSAEAALQELDRAVENIDSNIETVDEAIAAVRSGAPHREALEAQLEESIAEIVDLQAELVAGPTAERAAVIRTRLLDLQTQIATVRTLREVDAADPQAAALREERQALIARRSSLITTRNDLVIESELSSTGVAFYSPPLAAARVGSLGLARILAVGVLAGLALGVALAYLLAGRRRVFTDRDTPELVLGSPLLADVPLFSDEHLKGDLPALEAPRSAAAEAYRFAAASLSLAGTGGGHTFVAVSPLNGGGKTTTVANLGIALAREGQSVLVVDADFGNQELTNLLRTAAGEPAGEVPVGITEVVSGQTFLNAALQTIRLGGYEMTLLSRGAQPVLAVEFFRSAATRQFFNHVGAKYDFVLIDTPPLLQVAYSGTIAALADGAIAVVNHGSPVRQAEDMLSRLDFVKANLAGYLYNRAPLRREMTVVEGSMGDVIGDRGRVVK